MEATRVWARGRRAHGLAQREVVEPPEVVEGGRVDLDDRLPVGPGRASRPPARARRLAERVLEEVQPSSHREAALDEPHAGARPHRVGQDLPVAVLTQPFEQAVERAGRRRVRPADRDRRDVGAPVPCRDPHDAAAKPVRMRFRLRFHRRRA